MSPMVQKLLQPQNICFHGISVRLLQICTHYIYIRDPLNLIRLFLVDTITHLLVDGDTLQSHFRQGFMLNPIASINRVSFFIDRDRKKFRLSCHIRALVSCAFVRSQIGESSSHTQVRSQIEALLLKRLPHHSVNIDSLCRLFLMSCLIFLWLKDFEQSS